MREEEEDTGSRCAWQESNKYCLNKKGEKIVYKGVIIKVTLRKIKQSILNSRTTVTKSVEKTKKKN